MRRLARRDSRTHKSHAPCTVSCLRHLERSTEVAPRRLLLQAERYSESHTFLRSVFVLQRKVHRLRSWRRAAGKARITLGAMPVRAPLILQSSPSPESIGSVRGRSSSAPREAWTEHEHHRIELHRSVLFLRELVLIDGMAIPRGQSFGLRASHEWYRPISLLCVQGRVCGRPRDGREVALCVESGHIRVALALRPFVGDSDSVG